MMSELTPRGALAVEVTCLSVAFIFVLLYWYVRAHILRQFAPSDVLITFAWICMLGNTICDSFAVRFGLWNTKLRYTTQGLPDYEEVIHDRTVLSKSFKMMYGTVPIYYAVLYEVKAAILIMYLKLFPRNFVKLRICLWATIVFVVVGLVLVLGLNLLWCMPVYRNWTLNPKERCLSYASLTPYFFSSAFNIISDLLIFGLPFFLLPKLTANSSRRKLMGIAFVFSLGLLCIVCTVARIVFVGQSATSPLIAAWSSAEMGVAVIVACCPPLKYLLYATRRGRGSSAASGATHQSGSRRSNRGRTWPSLPSLPSFKSRSRSRSRTGKACRFKIKSKKKELTPDVETTVPIATIVSASTYDGTAGMDRTGRSLTITGNSSYIPVTGTDGRSAGLTELDLEAEMAENYGGLSPRGSARPVASLPPALMRLSTSSNSPPSSAAPSMAVSTVGDGNGTVTSSRPSSICSRQNYNIPARNSSDNGSGVRRTEKKSRRSGDYSGWRKWIRGGSSGSSKKDTRKPKGDFGNLTFGAGSAVRSDWRNREQIREEEEPEEDVNTKFLIHPPPKSKGKHTSTIQVRDVERIRQSAYEMQYRSSNPQLSPQRPINQPQQQNRPQLANVNTTFNNSFTTSNNRRSLSPNGAGFGFLNSEYMDGRNLSPTASASSLALASRRTSRSSYANGGDNVCGNFGSSIFGGD